MADNEQRKIEFKKSTNVRLKKFSPKENEENKELQVLKQVSHYDYVKKDDDIDRLVI